MRTSQKPAIRNLTHQSSREQSRAAAARIGRSSFLSASDDGRGLDHARIERKARERGLYPEGGTLTRSQVDALIFEPGFSTAEAVTEISGRRVGMDVVRRNIHALRGTIAVSSELGSGTTFTITVPFDLIILDGTLIEAGITT